MAGQRRPDHRGIALLPLTFSSLTALAYLESLSCPAYDWIPRPSSFVLLEYLRR